MRSSTSLSRARGVSCALALLLSSLALPARADATHKKPGKSLAACATFTQKDASDTTVDFTVDNACTVAVTCTVSWSVTCAPDAPKKRSKKYEGATFTLDAAQLRTTTASADRCGDDGWAIEDVTWTCAPAKD